VVILLSIVMQYRWIARAMPGGGLRNLGLSFPFPEDRFSEM
jgi:hypothetical protein